MTDTVKTIATTTTPTVATPAPEASIGLAYEVEEDGVSCRITGIGSCTDSNLVIGSYLDGYKVTRIDDYAFSFCRQITSLTIPRRVVSIGDRAFSGCASLGSFSFGGTTDEWKKLDKGDDWRRGVPATKVVCSDGEVII